MPITLTQRHTISAGSTRLVRVNCTNDLDDGASLTGTPTIVEVTTSALTLAGKAVNSATYTDAVTGTTVAVGKALQFTVTGGVVGTSYTIRCTCATNSTPAETLVYDLVLSFT
jgi:hypothetical protein